MSLKGYDGNMILIGDRVELHPGTDLWMRGAKYGRVVATDSATRYATLELDTVAGRRKFHETRIRRVV